MAKLERRSEANHGMRANYKAAYWTPPLTPKRAYDLESQQIEKLDMAAMVSLTDHDNIRAPQILLSAGEAPSLPVSVEWTAPYGDQSFHLGIHNLPAAGASIWMEVLAGYTSNPSEERLKEILVALDAEPEVLVVFNHPMWDLYLVGTRTHNFLVNEFIHGRHHDLEQRVEPRTTSSAALASANGVIPDIDKHHGHLAALTGEHVVTLFEQP